MLGDFGIRYVLLPGPVDPVLAQRLDAALGLVALSKAPTYDLWQVTGPVARARVVAADGTTTALASGTVDMSGVSVPAAGGTLVLAEPYGGWTAKLNGRALTPVKTPVDGWAQGFVLPAGGGKLSLARNDLARLASLAAELIALLVICVLALPGKRADPVEEAETLAALREARQDRRAAGTARRGARAPRTDGAGRRAAAASAVASAGAGRLGLARKRLAGRRAGGAGDETGTDAGVLTTAPDDATAALVGGGASRDSASRDGLTGTAGLGAPERASGGGYRRETGARREPWDMTGDWVARPAEQADARASGARSSGDTGSTGSRAAGSWEQGDPWTDDDPGATTQWARRDSGSLPQAQHADAWGTGPRRKPREPETESPLSSTGSQPRPVWDSGPQEPVSATGSRPAASSGGQPRYAWESGPQRRVPAAGGLPPSPRESGPQSPVSGTGSQPAAATGGRPRFPWGSGPQRSVPVTGSQPATPTGGQPAGRAPWESPDWGADSGWGTTTDRRRRRPGRGRGSRLGHEPGARGRGTACS